MTEPQTFYSADYYRWWTSRNDPVEPPLTAAEAAYDATRPEREARAAATLLRTFGP